MSSIRITIITHVQSFFESRTSYFLGALAIVCTFIEQGGVFAESPERVKVGHSGKDRFQSILFWALNKKVTEPLDNHILGRKGEKIHFVCVCVCVMSEREDILKIQDHLMCSQNYSRCCSSTHASTNLNVYQSESVTVIDHTVLFSKKHILKANMSKSVASQT